MEPSDVEPPKPIESAISDVYVASLSAFVDSAQRVVDRRTTFAVLDALEAMGEEH